MNLRRSISDSRPAVGYLVVLRVVAIDGYFPMSLVIFRGTASLEKALASLEDFGPVSIIPLWSAYDHDPWHEKDSPNEGDQRGGQHEESKLEKEEKAGEKEGNCAEDTITIKTMTAGRRWGGEGGEE